MDAVGEKYTVTVFNGQVQPCGTDTHKCILLRADIVRHFQHASAKSFSLCAIAFGYFSAHMHKPNQKTNEKVRKN
eukprot:m.1643694 g.1643694  ORF g.1643694 m.1643694 type:complete len:75 (-) comp59632_c0_seq1:71-295(-)